MNETMMTLVGNLVEAPRLRRTKSGHYVANFRVASTPRRYDREKNAWVDGATLFVTVTAWRAMAQNVAESLQKGQPVVVTGRYYQHEYEKNEALKTSYELEAIAVGPDLSRGVASFEKVNRPAFTTTVEVDPEGRPMDDSDDYLDLADDAAAEIDLDTGEIRELATAS